MISAALAILETEAERNELSSIYERNKKQFYRIAFAILHNQHDAEDAIQEAFLSIAKNAKAFFDVPVNKRVSYINIVVRNISYRMWNKKHNVDENQQELNDDIADECITVEEKVLSDFSCRRILEFINTMPESTKTAIYLRMYMNLKNADIAKALGISEEAAKKRVSRGINQIRQFVEGMDDE